VNPLAWAVLIVATEVELAAIIWVVWRAVSAL
jgi:hypothetical protein